MRDILKKLKELRSLCLQNCGRIEDHSPISSCKKLTGVEIENSATFSDFDLEKIAKNKVLKWLKIKKCPKVSDTGIESIARNCPLREVLLFNKNLYNKNLILDRFEHV